MERLNLGEGILRGPLQTMEMGRSLAVSLAPVGKVCSFDCAYCPLGRTLHPTLDPKACRFPLAEEILDAAERGLRSEAAFDCLAFTGGGEPTLHPRFPEIAREIRTLLDRLRPRVNLAVLSNSTTVHRSEVREALGLFDAPVLKLDAGDAKTLLRLNRPAPGVDLESLIAGLREVPRLVVRGLLVKGTVSNAEGRAHEAWLRALERVRPREVWIGSLDRPLPEFGLTRVPPGELREIASRVGRLVGVPVRAFIRPSRRS